MKTFVIDTNVVVSAFLTPHGNSGRLFEALLDGRFMLAYDSRILMEYIEVLSRPKFALPKEQVEFFRFAMMMQTQVSPVFLDSEFPDPDDKMFVEAALATADRVVVTGNARHFPAKLTKPVGVSILTPAAALEAVNS